jgi:hypothetical protein
LHTSTSFLPDQLAVAVSGAMTPFYFAENDWGGERQRGHENKVASSSGLPFFWATP